MSAIITTHRETSRQAEIRAKVVISTIKDERLQQATLVLMAIRTHQNLGQQKITTWSHSDRSISKQPLQIIML